MPLYQSQEKAFAPGISGDWDNIIPIDSNSRLKRVVEDTTDESMYEVCKGYGLIEICDENAKFTKFIISTNKHADELINAILDIKEKAGLS